MESPNLIQQTDEMNTLLKEFTLSDGVVWIEQTEVNPVSKRLEIRWFAYFPQILPEDVELTTMFIPASIYLYANIFVMSKNRAFPEGDEESIALLKKVLTRLEKALVKKTSREIEILLKILPYQHELIYDGLDIFPDFMRFQLAFLKCYAIFSKNYGFLLNRETLFKFLKLPCLTEFLEVLGINPDEGDFGIETDDFNYTIEILPPEEDPNEEIILFQGRRA